MNPTEHMAGTSQPTGRFETFTASQWVARPAAEVFPFFANPINLERITPPWLGFRMLNASTDEICEGTTIDYALRIHGIPLRWRSRIESWKDQECFVDVQEKGPYAAWYHTHLFVEERGGTLLQDIVRYRLPGGWLGQQLAGRWVRRDVQGIFNYRQQVIAGLFS